MVTFPIERYVSEDKAYREGFCLSDDVKPTGDTTMANGSKLIEMDTSTIYYYDETNGEWWPWLSSNSPSDASGDEDDSSEVIVE